MATAKRMASACELGDLDDIRAALASSDANFHISSCCRAFAGALRRNQASIAAVLLNHGFEIKESHIAVAVRNRQYEMLQTFIDAGWDINSHYGRIAAPALTTALDDEMMIDWLLRHDADPNAASMSGDTPLSHAVERAQLPVIKTLLGHVKNVLHGYLLHRAVYRTQTDRLDVCKLLLERGAPVNQVMYQDHIDEYMMMAFENLGTPLHMAAEHGILDVVVLLLGNGADPFIEDSKGLTVMSRADEAGHADIASIPSQHSKDGTVNA